MVKYTITLLLCVSLVGVAMAIYPYIQVEAGKILVVDGLIQFAPSEEPIGTLTNGLVLYWPMDETNGTTATDYSGLGNDGTISGGVTLGATGKVTKCMQFDGTDGVITRTTVTNLPIGASPRTIACWVFRGDTTGADVFYVWGVPSTAMCCELYTEDNGTPSGTYYFYFAGGNCDLQSGSLYTNGVWHHAVQVYDGTNLMHYINGAPDGSAARELNTADSELSVGGYNAQSAFYMPGSLDEFTIWNRVLTTNEIARLWNSGKGRSLKE